MVGMIAPSVGGDASNRRKILLLHIAGGVLGGLTVGILLGFVGVLLEHAVPGPFRYGLPVVFPAVCLYAGLADLNLRKLPRVGWRRQTPRWFPCVFGESGGCFAWGYDLGCVVTTRFPFQSMILAPMFAILVGDVVTATAAMMLLGGGRAVAVAVTVALSGDKHDKACSWISGQSAHLRFVVGAGAATTAAAVLLAWLQHRSSF